MRIGTACANGGPRGAVPTRDWRADELAKQPQGRQDFVSDSDLEHDGRAPGESRVLDADLIAISEMRSRTAGRVMTSSRVLQRFFRARNFEAL